MIIGNNLVSKSNNVFVEFVHNINDLAKDKYDDYTYDHAIKVSKYAIDFTMSTNMAITLFEDSCLIEALGIAHDLIEDTDLTYDDIKSCFPDKIPVMAKKIFIDSLEILTRRKDESYEDYIDRVHINRVTYPYSYIVKIADMKDHLCRKETLTDRLKNKYVNALAVLL